jgi:RNA polymerase primary sigma factor
VEIGRAPLISIDEEIELAQKIRKGGPEEKN